MVIWGKLVKKAHKILYRRYYLKNKQPGATSLRYVIGGSDSYVLSLMWSIPQLFIFYSFRHWKDARMSVLFLKQQVVGINLRSSLITQHNEELVWETFLWHSMNISLTLSS